MILEITIIFSRVELLVKNNNNSCCIAQQGLLSVIIPVLQIKKRYYVQKRIAQDTAK